MTSPSNDGSRSWLDGFSLQIPVAIILVALLATSIYELCGLSAQHGRMSPDAKKLALPEVQKQVTQAEAYAQKYQALVAELNRLAPTDPVAKKILEDFRAQLQQRR